MKNYRPQKAPVDFSKKVMDQLHDLSVPNAYRPVFGRWFLPFFLGALAVFVSVTVFVSGISGSAGTTSGLFNKLPKTDLQVLDEANRSFVSLFDQIPTVLIFALMGIAMLLILDRILSKRYQTRKA